LPRAAHWVRLANEPRVTFAAAVDSKTGDNALTGAEKPKIDTSKRNTDGTAITRAGLFTRLRLLNTYTSKKIPLILAFFWSVLNISKQF